MAPAPPLGLRDQKKQRTRAHLAHVATLLFVERGFDPTTIADVAAVAEVSKNTVTNYFPLKEDLVFDAHAEVVDSLAVIARDRRPGESALHALRRTYLASLDRFDVVNGLCTPDFAALVAGNPRLRARERELDEWREAALADALADATGADDPPPDLAAAQLAATHRPLLRRARELVGEGVAVGEDAPASTARSRLEPLAEAAFDLIEPVLGGCFVRPPRDSSGRSA